MPGKITVKLSNTNKPAPRWYRKTKTAVLILTMAANTMIASYGFEDALLVTRLQLWFTIGIGAILEAIGAVLANGEVYAPDPQTEEPPQS